jgi:DNA gyrase subunit B
MSDIHFRLAGHHEMMETTQAKKLLDIILDVESMILTLERKGLPFREFLGKANSEGVLPRYQVHIDDEPALFAYSKDELVEFKERYIDKQRIRHETTLASIPEAEQTPQTKVFQPKPFQPLELYDDQYMNKVRETLASFSLTLQQYLIAEGKILDIVGENEEITPIFTLKEIIEFLRENGRKGIEIQRYKGLGEMNADQLWETTMDPKIRTLIQVTIPDAIAADHMFSMLMGEEVAPRRQFIENHALSVKNLDI